MTITAGQLRELHEADAATAFDKMAELFNGELAKRDEEVAKRNKTIGELRAGRVSRAILDQLAETGQVPDEHLDDETVKKLSKTRRELDEARTLAESRADYDDLKKALEEATTGSGTLQADLAEAKEALGKYQAKEDQAWRQDAILSVAKEHKIPLRPGLVRFAEQTLRDFVHRGDDGSLSISRDGKPVLDAKGKEVDAKTLLEDLRHGKIVGSENVASDLFDQITDGPSPEHADGNGNPPPSARTAAMDAALQTGSLKSIHAAAYGPPPDPGK